LFRILFRPFLKTFRNVEWKKTSDFVEEKYDQISGSYIEWKYKKAKKINFHYINGVIKRTSLFEREKNLMEEYYMILSKYKFKNILEVGAGELTILDSLVDFIDKDVNYYALDLSLNRVYQGRNAFLKRHSCNLEVCKANAKALPYPDNYFDMVFTSHCLEHMPHDYKKAIDEMCRVAKKVVILFEPSYELGNISEKIRTIAFDYVKGISSYISLIKNAELSKHFFLKNGRVFNRTACYIVDLTKSLNEKVEEGRSFNYVCPSCKEKLLIKKEYLLCESCQKASLIFEDIPILDDKYSFYVGNKYE